MMSDLLVIIPAYNEAANIERVVSHLAESFPQYDYIVINDGFPGQNGGKSAGETSSIFWICR